MPRKFKKCRKKIGRLSRRQADSKTRIGNFVDVSTASVSPDNIYRVTPSFPITASFYVPAAPTAPTSDLADPPASSEASPTDDQKASLDLQSTLAEINRRARSSKSQLAIICARAAIDRPNQAP